MNDTSNLSGYSNFELDQGAFSDAGLQLVLDNGSGSPCVNISSELQPYSALFILYTFVVPVFIFVGLIGNVLMLLTLNLGPGSHSGSNTNLFLSAKAVADFLHCVAALLWNLNAYESVADTNDYRWFYYHFLYKPVNVMLNCFVLASTWYAVMVTMERMLVVGWPLEARYAFTPKRFAVIIVSVALGSLLCTLYPVFWLDEVVMVDCLNPEHRRIYRVVGPLSKEQPGLWYYGFASRLVHNVLATVAPLTFLVVLNSLLIWCLRQHRLSMTRFADAGYSSRDAGDQMRISLVVSVITVATAVFLLPSAFVVIYDSIYRHWKPRWYRSLVHTANFLVLCDKVIDFYLYCVSSAQFRRRLIGVLRCLLWRGRRESAKSAELVLTAIYGDDDFVKANGAYRRQSNTSAAGGHMKTTNL